MGCWAVKGDARFTFDFPIANVDYFQVGGIGVAHLVGGGVGYCYVLFTMSGYNAAWDVIIETEWFAFQVGATTTVTIEVTFYEEKEEGLVPTETNSTSIILVAKA